MKWFACFVAVLALLAAVACSPGIVNAQNPQCENGVCRLPGSPVLISQPVIGQPVFYEPAPVLLSPHCSPVVSPAFHSAPFCGQPVSYGCNGPHCRPPVHSWRQGYDGRRSGSVGISIHWNRSGSGRYGGRWH